MSNLNIGTAAKSIDIGRKLDAYTGVIVNAGQSQSGEELVYYAGDDTGYVIEVNTPLGSQEMADSILASLKARKTRYQAFDASGAIVNPAAELGDGVTVDGTDGLIFSKRVHHSRLMATDIASPFEEEVNHEYKYESRTQREFTRSMGSFKSRLSITEQQIEAKVSRTGGNASSFGWVLDAESHTWYANDTEVMRVNANGLKIRGEIYATSGMIGDARIEDGVLTIRNINADYITAGTLNVARIANGSITGGSGGKIANETLTTYNTSSGINTSLGYASSYGVLTNTYNPSTYPSYFKAGTIWANSLVVAGYGFVRGTSFVLNGITHYPWEYQA